MELDKLTGTDLALWLRGYQAARAGEPFDETRTDPWRDGFIYWRLAAADQREKSECH